MATLHKSLNVIARTRDDGKLLLISPSVGYLRNAPALGSLVNQGGSAGALEILGELVALNVPANISGIVVNDDACAKRDSTRAAIAFGDVIAVLDQNAALGEHHAQAAAATAARSHAGLVLRSPSSGRYYARPAPGKDAFVKVGDVVSVGQTVALLEVMKTFNRVLYGSAELPQKARVKAIVAQPESDVAVGDVLLELEAADV